MARRLVGALVLGYLAVAPSEIPPYRFDPNWRPVAVLQVGSPMASLDAARRRTATPAA